MMPVRFLSCYVEMLPVIKAEESLRMHQAVATGVGPRSKRQGQQVKKQLRDWQRTTQRFSGAPRARKAASFEDMKAAMAALGIRVKEAARG